MLDSNLLHIKLFSWNLCYQDLILKYHILNLSIEKKCYHSECEGLETILMHKVPFSRQVLQLK